jgi:ABC-type antimicrobial peptide transport system permease subunit
LWGITLVEEIILCVFIGILAGVYPAWRASRNQPAIALSRTRT